MKLNQFLKFKFFTANRISTMHDFGYVALNMKYANPEDSGTYTCRAINELGQAVTSSSLIVQCKLALRFLNYEIMIRIERRMKLL